MAKVSIVMGSDSDMPVMAQAADFLEEPIVVARATGTCVTPKECKRK